MASKGPRSKLDHETRARRQKALEAPREPRRPKTHWDHVLEEMVWLSKDFESERKWKLTQAKKVALKASKGMLDQATRGERKLKEEEQRLRKVALNISKDVKKFWVKIEKLVHYKHQMELDEKKKKTLDKQLEFLLGQTERYSTMLAENLIDSHNRVQKSPVRPERLSIEYKEADENNTEEISDLMKDPSANTEDIDGDYDVQPEEESEDDEHTIEEDEAHITEEERKEELEALRSETNIPLEELLKHYAVDKVNRGSTPEVDEDDDGDKLAMVEEDHEKCNDIGLHVGNKIDNLVEDHEKCDDNGLPFGYKMDIGSSLVRRCGESNGSLSTSDNHALALETSLVKDSSDICRITDQQHDAYDFNDEKEDGDFVLATGEENDDETTLLEEEELAKADSNDHVDEVALLQKESEIPLEELLARYKKHFHNDETSDDESQYASALSEDLSDSPPREDIKSKDQDNLMGENVDPSESQLVMHSPAEEQGTESQQNVEEGRESENVIADAAAAARSAQPTGITFSTTQVRTKFPFLLKYPLREYQHIGLDWLVTMYEKRLNGILADEMGLGKTIMTIALLAHLACEKGIWGPHLIVVPTSVMLNWETEFLKWCPAFKILTYFGSAKERKLKRQGWLKPNFFHVCITTYRLVIQDSKIFKRKKWKYLILDEAHLIKNWKSQRWQTLLNFNSKRRILLTGTPLQNDLMELWSLMHFLMPHIFQSHQEFKEWFTNPISGMVEGQEKVNKEVVDRLHNVLRPFILRRLKRDVEKQLPMKHEHVIYCRLSKRQRNLYEDFIASSETQATLASANFFGMISVIMQLRKVCNHPDLFEGRPIVSSFDMGGIDIQLSSPVCSMLSPDPFLTVDLEALGFLFTHLDFSMTSWECDERKSIATPPSLIKERVDRATLEEIGPFSKHRKKFRGTNIFDKIQKALLEERLKEAKDRAASIAWWNSLRCQKKPVYSTSLQELLTVGSRVSAMHYQKADQMSYLYSSKLADIVLSPTERFERMIDLVESFMFAIPAARAPAPVCWCSKTGASVFLDPFYKKQCSEVLLPLLSPIRPAMVRRQVYFPDRRLIQFDCGKLQELAVLLRKLKSEGHRALIFTQMTKMLDILEAFINLYGYTYMRLDGSTLPEERQTLMQRFNTNPKIFLFILSTRSGGVGINLVGADTVIFYDSDWNPAMDQQAQDRCHRIGQTREVHIYRLISKSTIEENILRKANQKRALDDLVIQSGSYNTEFFKKLDPMELFSGHRTLPAKSMQKEKANDGVEVSLSNADVEAALKSAEDEADYMALKRVEQEEAVDNQEFAEEAIGKLEDDELVNEENVKIDELADQGGCLSTPKHDQRMMLNGIGPEEERAVTFAAKEDDVDMLADVQQMAAAAAAAGQAILSFDNQLRPIDRYAMRFLELWDPIIDKAAVETEVRFEERDWELDRIEKYKEEMEAEIDEDEEPFVYERWDSDIATEAYRQQVEVLAQHQLMEEMEAEAKEKEDAEKLDADSTKYERARNPKPKSKKKPKKAKFKSLKKGNLNSESKTELTFETMSIDDDMYDDEATTSDAASPPSSGNKKRKKVESSIFAEEENGSKKSKKFKKGVSRICSSDLDSSSRKQNDGSTELRPNNGVVVEVEQKSASRGKMGGKISITTMPVKRVLMIKPEKLRKGNFWSRDYIPSPDVWLPQEDSILCAVVHEYGPSWSLVSEILYGMTAGGFYRGRYRHPVHCCERFRELIQRYVLSAPDNPINEKGSGMGSGKALLKVTEDNVRVLLNVAAEQADNELLLQKHFTALLSSVWKMKSPHQKRKNLLSLRNGLFFGASLFNSFSKTSLNSMNGPSGKMKFTISGPNSRLLLDALHDSSSEHDKGSSDSMEDCAVMSEQLAITLEFPEQLDASSIGFPRIVNLSIHGEDSVKFIGKPFREDKHLKDSQSVAEKRFRDAARACDDDNLGWASSSAFPANDPKLRSASKLHSLGKHKISFSDSVRPKSKSKKISVEHAETVGCLYPEPTRITTTKDPNLSFDFTSDFIHEEWLDDMNGNLLSRMDKHLSFETDSFDIIPHDYSPGLISDLEDYSIWSDHTDIG